jgi:hypothetical protein
MGKIIHKLKLNNMSQVLGKSPETLIEIIRGDQKDHLLKFGFSIQLTAGGMHSGPAICEMEPGKKKEVIYTDDLSVLEDLWNLLPPESSRVIPVLYYGNPDENKWFVVTDGLLRGEDYKTAKPFHFVSRKKFEELKEATKFMWGLVVVGNSVSKEQWPKYIAEAIKEVKAQYA